MRDYWVTNYKRHYYFQNLNEHQQVQLHVNNTGIRFTLELIDEKTKKDYPIACSNNMQILKDLIHAIKNKLDENYIRTSFHMLEISNLNLLL